MRFQTLYDVPCPYCGARAGAFCRVARGRPEALGRSLPAPHVARRTAYRVAAAGEPVRRGS